MKGIVELNIKIQVVTDSQEEFDELIASPEKIVDEECFINMGKRILEATVIDTELLDFGIDPEKLLNSRE